MVQGTSRITFSGFCGMALLLISACCLSGFGTDARAQSVTTWEDISSSVSVQVENPRRSRRSNDATVRVQLTNISGGAYEDPIRLVLEGLDSYGVSLGNADGTTEEGAPYVVISDSGLGAGVTTEWMTLNIVGGRAYFELDPSVYTDQEDTGGGDPVLPTVQITSPETLTTVGTQTVEVLGTVSANTDRLTVNGEVVDIDNGTFEVFVSLNQGLNNIAARATTADGNEATDLIVVSQDLTPPVVTIDTPINNAVVYTDRVAVSGLVNDIVRGTVEAKDAVVTVNGVNAAIQNRTYSASSIALTEGVNTITVRATDQVGNTGEAEVNVTYVVPDPQRIEQVSGSDQTGQILSTLPQPFKVQLLGSDGNPVADKVVVFRVAQGDGKVAAGTALEGRAVLVQTGADGMAQTTFRVGSRSGAGNQRVRATASGFDGEAIFIASTTPKPGNKIGIIDGNNQRTAPGQPLPKPLTVSVTDEGANLVEGAEVKFTVSQGGGKFSNGQSEIVKNTDGDGRASAILMVGDQIGLDVHRVTAALIGTTATAGFTASALKVGNAGQTSISGIVLDNQDNPLPGTTIRIEGVNRQATADENGQFKIDGVPVGPVHILADGSTTTVEGTWPTLSYNLVTVAGADNPLPSPIYMVKLNTANAQMVGGDSDVVYTLEEVPGFQLTVKAGSVTFPDGSKEGLLSVTPVNANKIPMAPPNGMQPQFIVTIQPAGAKFDPPAPLQLPNVDTYAPGAEVEMYSYDHDLEEFVTIGLGTVSDDGAVIRSNKGVGVVKAGWHCGNQPGGSGCCAKCGDCESIDGNCNCQKDPNKELEDKPGDCKKPGPNGCMNGSPDYENDDGDKPEDKVGDCKKPICMNGSPDTEIETSDSPPDDKCKFCDPTGTLQDKAKLFEGPSVESKVSREIPSDLIDSINDWLKPIDRLPGADISVSHPTIELSGKQSACCDRDTGEVTPLGLQELSGRAKIEVAGDFLIPWPIPGVALEAKIEVDFGWLGSAFLSLDLEGGLFFDVKADVGGGVTIKTDACNDLEQCLLIDFGGTLTPALDLKLEATACSGYESSWAGSYEECASVNFKPGRVAWKFCTGGKYGIGDCGGDTGFNGAVFGNGGLTLSFSFGASVKEKTNNTTVEATSGLTFSLGPYFASASGAACR